MAPTIRIDDEVYEWLQKQGKAFEDTPNSVLRKIAGLDEQSNRPIEKRTSSNEGGVGDERKTPQPAYREPILKILKRAGGEASRTEVLKELASMLKGRLTPYDREKIRTGAIRWEKTAEWAVREMREEHLIQPVEKTARGIWALTAKGLEAAAQ